MFPTIYLIKFVYWWANWFSRTAQWWADKCHACANNLRKRISHKQEALRKKASKTVAEVAEEHTRIEKAAEQAKLEATRVADDNASAMRDKAKGMDDKYNACIL